MVFVSNLVKIFTLIVDESMQTTFEIIVNAFINIFKLNNFHINILIINNLTVI